MQSLVRLLRKSENKIGDCKVGAGHQNPGVLWEQAVRLWGAREVFPQDLPKTPLRHEESSRRVVAPKSINGTFPTYQNLGTSNTLASILHHRLPQATGIFPGTSAPQEERLHLVCKLLYLQCLTWSLAQGTR